MSSFLAIVLGALGLLYAWWPLRRTVSAPPLPDEGAAVNDPAIAREAFEVARRWSVAAGEIRSAAAAGEARTVGAAENRSAPVDPLERTDAPSAGRTLADQGDEEGS